MRMFRTIALLLAAAAALAPAGCNHSGDPVYQGWVEADLVFVAPDETGRVETLSVREGDTVTAGAPLFTLDDDLQQADVQQNQATLANMRATFDRAQQLVKTGSGTQKAFDYVKFIKNRQLDRYLRQLIEPARGNDRPLAVFEEEINDEIPVNAVGREAKEHGEKCSAPQMARSSKSTTGPAKWCPPAGRCSRSSRPGI